MSPAPGPEDETRAQSVEEVLARRVRELEASLAARDAELRERTDEVSLLRARQLRAGEADAALGTALTEREAVFSEVERMAHVGSWVWDLATNRVLWSTELFRILGYDPATDEPSTELFFEAIHPDDRAAIQERSRETSLTGRTEPRANCRVVQRSGRVRYVEVIGSAIHDQSGQMSRLVGAVFDVTEFVERQAELRRVAERLNEAEQIAGLGTFSSSVSAHDYDHSENLGKIFGLSAGEQLTRTQFLAAVQADDRERVEEFRIALLNGVKVAPLEFRIARPGGGFRHMWMSARLEPAFEHRPARVVGTLQDISQRRELEEQLRHSQKMEAVGSLAGGVAHDFNNYLVVIRGNLDLLEMMLERESEREILREIGRAADRCAALTRQLLAFGRKHASAPRSVSLAQIVVESGNMLRRLLGEHIELVVHAEASRSVVLADPAHLELVVMNLAVNARDAMPMGGTLTLEVSEQFLDADEAHVRPNLLPGKHALLRVTDTGTGIPDEVKKRIFEPFFTTKSPGHGTGLGLATVYAIVHQWGGHIELESGVGHGTCFSVFLPCRSPSEEPPPPSTRPSPQARGEIVLLVEDEESVRRLTRRLLERGGYGVLEAEHGLAALAVAERAERIDLLLTDITMPKLDGISLAKKLRALRPRLAVILMSGYPDAGLLAAHKPEFTYEILNKPFTLDHLLSAVRRMLDAPLSPRKP